MTGARTYDDQIEIERNIGIDNFGWDKRTEISLDESIVCWARGHGSGGILVRSTGISENSTRESSIFWESSVKR